MYRAVLIFIILTLPMIAMAKSSSAYNLKDPKVEYKKAIKSLAYVKSLKCFFPQGKFASWKKNKLVVENDRMPGATHFDSIDAFKKKRARIIGNLGAENVVALISPTRLTFFLKIRKLEIKFTHQYFLHM